MTCASGNAARSVPTLTIKKRKPFTSNRPFVPARSTNIQPTLALGKENCSNGYTSVTLARVSNDGVLSFRFPRIPVAWAANSSKRCC